MGSSGRFRLLFSTTKSRAFPGSPRVAPRSVPACESEARAGAVRRHALVGCRTILRYDLEHMHGVRSGVVGLCCALFAAVVPACGEDEPLFPGPPGAGGASGEAGEGGDAGARPGAGGTRAGSAGESGGEAGEGNAGAGAGGSGGSRNDAGEGGEGNSSRGGSGATNQGGASGDANGGSSGSSAGGSGGNGNPGQLQICDRLAAMTQTSALSYDLSMAYERTMVEDCRANWVTTLYFDGATNHNDRAPFLNMLIQWNLRLWGCQATLPKNFALIYQGDGVVPLLTRGDAQALIDSYIEVADDMLNLSPSERTDMRAIITRLSEPALLSNSDELSNSACSQNTGGASGSGGNAGTAGVAGAAGTAGSAGMGGASGNGGTAGSSGSDGAGGAGGEAGAVGE